MVKNKPVHILNRDHSLLLVVDVQEKLAPAILGIDSMLTRLQMLLRGVKALDVPVIFTEHCPEKIGSTVASLRSLAQNACYVPKTWFGATRQEEICRQLHSSERRQIVIAGAEAHVCVMQTALGLLEQEYEVFMVIDAIGSRERQDKEIAIERLCSAGVIPVTSEMVLFEWLAHADADSFRDILRMIKSIGK